MLLTRLLVSLAQAEEPPIPIDLAARVEASDPFQFDAPERLGVGVRALRGPFWLDLGLLAGIPDPNPDGLDLTLIAIAGYADPATDFTRVWSEDSWAVNLGLGVGNPQRVARRPVGSPFLWGGAEVRGVHTRTLVPDEGTVYRIGDEGSTVQVGPLLKAGFLVGVGTHGGVEIALEDRPRPDLNQDEGRLLHETDLALDLSWIF